MEERINRLKELLDKENYPSVYLFKFIIKKDDEKMQEIKLCFDESANLKIIFQKMEIMFLSVSGK